MPIINPTSWTKETINSTAWTKETINSTDWTKQTINPTNWSIGQIPTAFLLLQTGDYILQQDGGFIGLEQI